MTKLREKSSKKPFLAPVKDERQGDGSIPDPLEKLADRALEEFRAGRTRETGFDEL